MYEYDDYEKLKFKVVTICGSTKFKRDFEIIAKELTLNGFIVISIGGCYHHLDDDKRLKEKDAMLEVIHLARINMADIVYIINPNGYIGQSTAREIEYAKRTNKKIRYLEIPDTLSEYLKEKNEDFNNKLNIEKK
jgi:hypothetical protein